MNYKNWLRTLTLGLVGTGFILFAFQNCQKPLAVTQLDTETFLNLLESGKAYTFSMALNHYNQSISQDNGGAITPTPSRSYGINATRMKFSLISSSNDEIEQYNSMTKRWEKWDPSEGATSSETFQPMVLTANGWVDPYSPTVGLKFSLSGLNSIDIILNELKLGTIRLTGKGDLSGVEVLNYILERSANPDNGLFFSDELKNFSPPNDTRDLVRFSSASTDYQIYQEIFESLFFTESYNITNPNPAENCIKNNSNQCLTNLESAIGALVPFENNYPILYKLQPLSGGTLNVFTKNTTNEEYSLDSNLTGGKWSYQTKFNKTFLVIETLPPNLLDADTPYTPITLFVKDNFLQKGFLLKPSGTFTRLLSEDAMNKLVQIEEKYPYIEQSNSIQSSLMGSAPSTDQGL